MDELERRPHHQRLLAVPLNLAHGGPGNPLSPLLEPPAGIASAFGSTKDPQPACPSSKTSKMMGRCAMAHSESDYLPRQNPCAQCDNPIAVPDWVEQSPGRTAYLWYCRACDYRFESESRQAPLAA
jgi:hypothetical protein